MAVISGVALIRGGWDPVRKKTPRGTPSSSYTYVLNKSPQKSQTTTEDKANI